MMNNRPVDRPVIKIEKGVPKPPLGGGHMRGRRAFYPFQEMEVDDSFFLPCFPGKTAQKTSNIVTSAATSWRKRKGNNPRFKIRIEQRVENGVAGVRLWRLADRVT